MIGKKAAVGFEPTNSGFAIRSPETLSTCSDNGLRDVPPACMSEISQISAIVGRMTPENIAKVLAFARKLAGGTDG